MGIFPIFEQVAVYPELVTIDGSNHCVIHPWEIATFLETLWLSSFATSTGLIEHQFTVFFFQFPNDF